MAPVKPSKITIKREPAKPLPRKVPQRDGLSKAVGAMGKRFIGG